MKETGLVYHSDGWSGGCHLCGTGIVDIKKYGGISIYLVGKIIETVEKELSI